MKFRKCYPLPRHFIPAYKCCLCGKIGARYLYGIPDFVKRQCLCPCRCSHGKSEMSYGDGSCFCFPDGSAKLIALNRPFPLPYLTTKPNGFKPTVNPFQNKNFRKACRCEDGTQSFLLKKECQCDPCKLCPDGFSPKRTREGFCYCPFECGIFSVCTKRRKGYRCEEPLCKDQDCSGRGKCIALENCNATCVCNEGFQGESCEERVPRNAFGDPHLQTLDGKSYDYFGIGQFVGCISKHLAYQMRFFAYERTSFIGQVVLKIGLSSILSVTTNSQSSIDDLPTLRLDGQILSNLENNQRFLFDNETVRLDISSTPKENRKTDPTVLILSVKFSNGASLSVSTSFSPSIKRQYLSITTVPVDDMINTTSGLCGNMNDNSRDDFLGADGVTYTDPFRFVETYRMSLTVRDGAGLKDSWSDKHSNFHKDDSIDQSYNDITHKPVVSLVGFNWQTINRAKEICSTTNLNDIQKDQCVYDVVITNDESLSRQSILQGNLCPKQCSYRGNCFNRTCHCVEGWSGVACDYGSCGRCENGECEGGFCKCTPGFVGTACNETAECEGNCSGRGICVHTNVCSCDIGWTSSNCSEKAICLQGCSNRGVCIDHNICKCETGFGQYDCSTYTCETLNKCSGNGVCVLPGNCICYSGWSGSNCAKPICDKDCYKQGICTGPNKCECFAGYSGLFCNITESCPIVDNCSENGVCSGPDSCICDIGYEGNNCSLPVCEQSCSPNGLCEAPNQCRCKTGYTGNDCSKFSCEKLLMCSGHGICSAFDKCSCIDDWSGESCNIPSCKNISDCSGNGQCVGYNDCQCDSMFEGQDCSQPIETNRDRPTFLKEIYYAEVSEFLEIGETIVMVEANDTDKGKAGIIKYFISKSELRLKIDPKEGRITTDGILKPGFYSIQIEAIDSGVPSLRTMGIVNVTVYDVNECAKIKPSKDLLVLSDVPKSSVVHRIIAEDPDTGINAELYYNISINEFENDEVGLNVKSQTNEIITTKNPLQTGKYEVVVYAYDSTNNPCTVSSTIMVNIAPPNIDIDRLEVKKIKEKPFNVVTDSTEKDSTVVTRPRISESATQLNAESTDDLNNFRTSSYSTSEKNHFKTKKVTKFIDEETTESTEKVQSTNVSTETQKIIEELKTELKYYKLLTFTFIGVYNTVFVILMVVLGIKIFC